MRGNKVLVISLSSGFWVCHGILLMEPAILSIKRSRNNIRNPGLSKTWKLNRRGIKDRRERVTFHIYKTADSAHSLCCVTGNQTRQIGFFNKKKKKDNQTSRKMSTPSSGVTRTEISRLKISRCPIQSLNTWKLLAVQNKSKINAEALLPLPWCYLSIR